MQTILIADDNEDLRGMLRQLLESQGYSVLEAADGREAAERAVGERPALVIMDLGMPGMDGLSAVAEIRRQVPASETQVLIVSAYDRLEYRTEAVAAPGDEPLFVSVNLSGKQFTQRDLVGVVEQALAETGLEARSLKLEITETAIMENAEAATVMLKRLREIGVQLGIDDFGTGYSSLSYLHRFPVNTLKVDRSFVSRMDEASEYREIVRTIVSLAHTLRMEVVAEGVETRGQWAQLGALSCEYSQGYFFSKPMPADAAFEYLVDGRRKAEMPLGGAPDVSEAPELAESYSM